MSSRPSAASRSPQRSPHSSPRRAPVATARYTKHPSAWSTSPAAATSWRTWAGMGPGSAGRSLGAAWPRTPGWPPASPTAPRPSGPGGPRRGSVARSPPDNGLPSAPPLRSSRRTARRGVRAAAPPAARLPTPATARCRGCGGSRPPCWPPADCGPRPATRRTAPRKSPRPDGSRPASAAATMSRNTRSAPDEGLARCGSRSAAARSPGRDRRYTRSSQLAPRRRIEPRTSTCLPAHDLMGNPWAHHAAGPPREATVTSSDLGFLWHPQRDSNPCRHLERVVS